MSFYTVNFDLIEDFKDFGDSIECTINELKKILGVEPSFMDYLNYNAVTAEWDLETEDNILFSIHDYNTGYQYGDDDIITWYIETKTEKDSETIFNILSDKLEAIL